jgi:hypothetical protein
MSRIETRRCACARAGLPVNCRSCRFRRALRARNAREWAPRLIATRGSVLSQTTIARLAMT